MSMLTQAKQERWYKEALCTHCPVWIAVSTPITASSPKKPDLPSELGRGLSGGAGVDRMLFPIFLSPRAVEAARSQRHRGSTRGVSHALSPLGGEWPSLEYILHHIFRPLASWKAGVFMWRSDSWMLVTFAQLYFFYQGNDREKPQRGKLLASVVGGESFRSSQGWQPAAGSVRVRGWVPLRLPTPGSPEPRPSTPRVPASGALTLQELCGSATWREWEMGTFSFHFVYSVGVSQHALNNGDKWKPLTGLFVVCLLPVLLQHFGTCCRLWLSQHPCIPYPILQKGNWVSERGRILSKVTQHGMGKLEFEQRMLSLWFNCSILFKC